MITIALDLIIEFIKANSVEMLAIWGAIITIASLVAKLTPSKQDDALFGILMKILNALALNPNQNQIRKEVEREISERNDSTTRSNLTDALR